MFKKTLPLLFLGGLSFGITLQEAVNTALKNNLQLKAQYFHYRSAKNDFYSQLAARFGEIDFFWRYQQFKTPRIVAPISSFPPTGLDDQVRTYGLQYKVRLFDGCQQFFLIKAKKDTADLEWVNWEKLSKEVKRDVSKVYFAALEVRARLQALEERKKEVDRLYKIVKEAYEVGKKPLLDLLNVRAERKNVEAQISLLRSQYQTLLNQLKVLLNTDKPLEVEDIKVNPYRIDAKKFLSELLAKNPDLKVVSVQKTIADDYRKVAMAEFSPKVNFVYTTQKYVYAGRKTSDWYYAVEVNLPIFDFGRRFFTYRKAREEERRVNELHQQVEKKVLETFRSLVDKLNSQIEVIEANQKRVEFAKEAYKVEKKKYLTGKSDIYNLLKAEALYYNALGEYKASIYKWGELKAELDYLLGN